ncbi:MAG: hypothetical protein AAB926_00905 [Patescibacteria group bacterium]
MIYLFFGGDVDQSRRKIRFLIDDLETKQRAAVFRLDEEDFSKARFEEFLKANALFHNKCAVLLKDVFMDKEAADFVLANLDRAAASSNVFIFWENKLAADIIRKFKKLAENIFEFSLKTEPKKSAKELFNIFSLSDAFAARERRRAWLLYQRALAAGITAEEVFWKLVWQVKNLMVVKGLPLASQPAIVKATGWHPFVVKKTVESVGNFSQEELKNYSRRLVGLYHDCRFGLDDFSLGVERFILKL